MRSMTMELADGRRLSWAELGSEAATGVLIANHGTGSSRLELAIYDEVLGELGLRVLAPERPGYGQSTPLHRARSVAEWAADVAQLIDDLGIATFAVSGFSGGGPHALAISASPALSRRVSRVMLTAALAPEQAPRNAHDLEINKRAGRVSWQEFVDSYESEDEQPEMSPADKEAFAAPAYLEAAMATITEGTRQGPAGDASDRWAFATPWGFELTAVVQPVDIWHGDADTRVPVSHAYFLEAALPRAKLQILPGEGHFSIGRRTPDLLAGIASDL